MRTTHPFTTRTLLALLLTAAMALPGAALAAGAATDAGAFLVPAGDTVEVPAGVLEAREIVIDGDLVAAGALELRAATITINGRLLGAHGAPGQPGASLRLVAASIVVAPDALVAAGAGGHGPIAVAPEGDALGGHGGAGGSIVLDAPSLVLDGRVEPGRGGDGGDAYGLVAVGGDGGATGGVLANGAPVRPSGLARHPEAPVRLPDALPATSMTHCAMPVGAPAAPMSGANGGGACSHGLAGTPGQDGAAGDDDNCTTCGTTNHPPCGNYTTTGGDNKNGEKGQHGASYGVVDIHRPAPPTAGLPASATGGKGGDVPSSWMVAGNGGSAVATGGAGGRGGHGGMGGNAGATGSGCAGGNGGYGAPGGSATATGGLQGLNAFDCSKNGQSGTANAIGGGGGSMGYGGGGGGGNWPYSNGAPGAHGHPGPNGYGTPTVPPTLPCFPPGAPVLAASFMPVFCHRVNLNIVAPAFTGNSAVTSYKIWRGTSPTGLTLRATVTATGAAQTYQDTGVANGTTYYYQVSAVNPIGEGPRSNVATVSVWCATVSTGDLGGPIDFHDPITGPTLLAAPGPGSGVITLTITHPVSPSDTILTYNVYRGTVSGGANTLVANIPYGGPLPQQWQDTGLTIGTQYFYKVAGVTAGGEDPLSNEASAVAPLFIGTGGGFGHAYEIIETTDGGWSRRDCVDVPVELRLIREGDSFDLTLSYGEGRGRSGPRQPDDGWCRVAPRHESRQYENRQDGERVGQCEAPPAWFYEERTRFEAGRDISCSGKLVTTENVVFERGDSWGYVLHEIVSFDGERQRTWYFEAKVQTSTVGAAPPRHDPSCELVAQRAERYAGAGAGETARQCGLVAPLGVYDALPVPAPSDEQQKVVHTLVEPVVAPFHEPQPEACGVAGARECWHAARIAYATMYEQCMGAGGTHEGASALCFDAWFLAGGSAWYSLGCAGRGFQYDARGGPETAAWCAMKM